MSQSDNFDSRATIPEMPFERLNPSGLAKDLHQLLVEEIGPMLATAVLKDSARKMDLSLDHLEKKDLAGLVDLIIEPLQNYPQTDRAIARLRELAAG